MNTMIVDLAHILIFKTNIRTRYDKLRIQRLLDANESVSQWSVDHKDVDCVLRIVSDSLTPEQVIDQVKQQGFDCAELE